MHTRLPWFLGPVIVGAWAFSVVSAQPGGGPLAGAGIALNPVAGRMIIADLLPQGPAALAGIQVGDELVAVDGRAVYGLPYEQVTRMVSGPVGSQVVLGIARGGLGPWQVPVIRRPLNQAPASLPAAPARPGPATSAVPVPRPAGSDASAPGVTKFTRVALHDPQVNNVEAVQFLLPDGWQYRGEIVWMHEWSILAMTRLTVVDPRTNTTLDFLPPQQFVWPRQQLPGLAMHPGQNWLGHYMLPPISDPAQFVETFWAPGPLSHLRGLRPVQVQDMPGLANEYLRRWGGPGQARGYRLRYEFMRDGRPWEEEVTFGLLFAPPNAETSFWYVNFATTVRAPRGELERTRATTSTIVGSFTDTPEWVASYRVVKQAFTQGLRQMMADTAAFGRKLQEHRAEIARIRQEVAVERQASQDRVAIYRGELLSGTGSYRDTYSNQTVSLPDGGQEYWVNAQGEYLISQETGYDPNRAGGQAGWQRMERLDGAAR